MACGTVNVGQKPQAAIETATESKDGLMSAADKKKLDKISGEPASENGDGLMSAADKKKLDGIPKDAVSIKIANGTMVIT